MTHAHAFGGPPWEHPGRDRFFFAFAGEPGRRGKRRGMRGGFGPPRGGRRARRGDVRAGALLLLAEEPRNGYAIMQAIEERTSGMWRPSPGAVYPALQQLEDEGLIRADERDGRREYQLTDAGKTYVEERRDELVAPWDTVNESVDDSVFDLLQLTRQVHIAAVQLAHHGNEAQVAEGARALADTRRALYRILAGDEPAEEGQSPT